MSAFADIMTLEKAIPPEKLLYLHFGAEPRNEYARLIGLTIAQHPPESRRYLVEAVLTWARHYVDTGSDAGLASVAAAPLKKPHIVRHIISTQIRSEWPRKQLLGAKPEHAEQLLRILHYVSKRTTFTKSGDLMIHATLYADLPAEKIASLSLYELPYELAGVQYGVKANQKVRPIFETDPELRFSTVDWKTAEDPSALALAACLLAETHGVSFKVPILVAHQITYARPVEVPALFVDENGYGILWNRTFLQVDPGHPFPIAGTLVRYLELQALLGEEKGLAAQAVLRAIKEPARVRPPHHHHCRPPPPPPPPPPGGVPAVLPRERATHKRRHLGVQVGVREPLYPVIQSL